MSAIEFFSTEFFKLSKGFAGIANKQQQQNNVDTSTSILKVPQQNQQQIQLRHRVKNR